MTANDRLRRSATVAGAARTALASKQNPSSKHDRPPGKLYETDFYSWTQRQAALLRDGRLEEIDIENIVEEIETLGRSERSALRSAYRLIALHLLKLPHQPEKKTRSWIATIVRERDNAEVILKENPGLKPQRGELFASAYASARKEAVAETGLALKTFPATPPFTIEQLEDPAFPGLG